jgi:hypothetical protein
MQDGGGGLGRRMNRISFYECDEGSVPGLTDQIASLWLTSAALDSL